MLAIFLVHAFNLVDILSAENNVIVEFVPEGERCEFWAWEFGDWGKVEAENGSVKCVQDNCQCAISDEGGRKFHIRSIVCGKERRRRVSYIRDA